VIGFLEGREVKVSAAWRKQSTQLTNVSFFGRRVSLQGIVEEFDVHLEKPTRLAPSFNHQPTHLTSIAHLAALK
jgi:hypothetical protein